MARKLPETSEERNQRRREEYTEALAREGERQRFADDLERRAAAGEVPPRPWYPADYKPVTETGTLAALIADEDPALDAHVRWNHEHDGYPATAEHLRAARALITELVDALRYSHDANGVLPRIEAARRVLLNAPDGTELLARYAVFIRTMHQRYTGEEPGPLSGKQLLHSAWRALPQHFGSAFSRLPFERFERTVAGISTSAHPEAEGVYRVAADLAISVGAFNLAPTTDARTFAARLRTYAGRHK